MKKFFTLVCAVLGISATMMAETVDVTADFTVTGTSASVSAIKTAATTALAAADEAAALTSVVVSDANVSAISYTVTEEVDLMDKLADDSFVITAEDGASVVAKDANGKELATSSTFTSGSTTIGDLKEDMKIEAYEEEYVVAKATNITIQLPTGRNQVNITDIEGYDYIRIDATSADGFQYDNWGCVSAESTSTSDDAYVGNKFSCTVGATSASVSFNVADLITSIEANSYFPVNGTSFCLEFWDNTSSVTITGLSTISSLEVENASNQAIDVTLSTTTSVDPATNLLTLDSDIVLDFTTSGADVTFKATGEKEVEVTPEPGVTTTTKSLDISALYSNLGANAITAEALTNVGCDFITLIGTNTLKSSDYFESAKGEAFSVTLETAGTITIDLASTGAYNHTSFALADGDGEYLTLSTNIEGNEYVLGPGTNITDDGADNSIPNTNNVNITLGAGVYAIYTSGNHQAVTWTVEAGTYTFATNLTDAAFGRGARIYGITVEEGTTEVTPEADENGIIWDATNLVNVDGNYTWDELASYDAVKIVLTIDEGPNAQGGDSWVTWGAGGIYEYGTWDTAVISFEVYADGQDNEFIYDIEDDLKASLTSAVGFTMITWPPATAIAVYGGVYADVPAGDEETIDGYLTVTVGGEEVGDVNQEVTITVTEDADGKVTIDLGDLSVVVTISDASVTFTPGTDGTYTDGVVSGTISGSDISATATGTYEVVDGETTFTASFSYTVPIIGDLAIAVSFTTVEPVVPEVTWTLISDQFDATQFSGNNQIVIPMTTIEEYEYICIATTVDPAKYYGNYGAILTNLNGGSNSDGWGTEFGGSNFLYEDGHEVVYIVIAVADLKNAIVDSNLTYVVWDNVTAAAIYGSADYDGETGTFYPATESTTPGSTLEDIDILPNFTNDWASAATYDATTNTVTWASPGGYDGDGAWFGEVDYTGYAGISVTFTIESADYFQLVIEYANGTEKSVVAQNIEAGENTLFTPFDAAGITAVTQCYLQSGTIAQTIVITEAKVVVTAPATTAIASVASDVEVVEVARYNLMGQKISGAEKGINIIVYSDGSAKKVLVK